MSEGFRRDRGNLLGTGTLLREFLYADDLADAVFLMNNYSGNKPLNGTGKLTIKELTELTAKVIGYTGEIKGFPKV
ncbi:MAG: hypothetical protein ACLURV_11245 [Gallintestinimicrobium sp.]